MPARAFSRSQKRSAERSRNSRPTRLKGGSRNTNDAPLNQRSAHTSLSNPGDPVRESGIYEVVHDRSHRISHEVVMISGDRFPNCDTCDERVRFRLIRTAPYIFSDDDFEEER